MDTYLTFNIICLNEEERIEKTLKNIRELADEIIVIDGGSKDRTVEICSDYADYVEVKEFSGDFADQKNYANFKSNGRWIFNIDADEIMHDNLIEVLPKLLSNNEGIELFWIPRINIVHGLTDNHIEKWHWVVDDDKHINWPDFQGRLYKNTYAKLKWQGKVHERIVGFDSYAELPKDKDYGWYLIHEKDIERQEKQNKFYEEM